MSCSVKSCKNIKRLLPYDSGITFHRFPADELMFKKWLQAIGREKENKVRTRTMFLCSDHFSPEDFVYGHKMRRIKSDAIPVLNNFLEKSVPLTSDSFATQSSDSKEVEFPTKSISSASSSSKIDDLNHCPKNHNISPMKSASSGSSTLNVKQKRVKLDHSYVDSLTRYKLMKQAFVKKYVEQNKKLYKERQKVKKLKLKMSETEQHVQAKSDSLPKIDAWMVADFFYKNHCFSSFETGEVKEEYPERDLYADNSIGFVEVNRNNNICTVRCKMCFEHLAMKKHYTVVLKVNEETNQVISVTCVDCAASATGGCKHAVAFLMWTHRRSEASSPTTVECPLRKPQPAAIETSIKYVTTKDFGAEDPLDVDDGNEFLNDIFHSLKRHKIDSQLVKHLEVKNGADLLDLHGILIRFKENNGRDFFQYCTNIMSDALCIEAASKTVDQYKNDLWLKLRYARITASKLYDVAHCENPDGLIDQILENFCFKDDLVLERSRNVKSLVLKVVENEMKIKLSHTGLLLNKDHPVLCASPDGTSDEYIVEIKYPTSIESMENYITKDNRITAKYNAEVQLEMYFANKCKALYCVADPEFELNSKINIVHIEYNKECVEGLIQRAEFFWLKNILPIVLQSVAHI